MRALFGGIAVSGVNGKILRVDLSRGELAVEEPPEDLYRMYLGGEGFVAHYLMREMPAGTDPLGPDNVLIFATGVLTGHALPGSGRNSVGARSPLTGAFGTSEGGGWWGAELKRAGYDAIVIRGRSSRPVYLSIVDGEAEIRDAGDIWGASTAEAEATIRDQLGDRRVRVAQCGPAGERLVRFACIINDLRHAAGRTGMGAVMGAKQLRAVAVRGSGGPPVADRKGLQALAGKMIRQQKEKDTGLTEFGTPGVLMPLQLAGGLPTRNFRQGDFEGAERISAEAFNRGPLVGRDSCYACAASCKRVARTGPPWDVNPIYGGPEYETLASLGSTCGIDDLEAICKGHEIANAMGLDTISAGVAIGFAMECFENGILTAEDTEGLDLRSGQAEAMIAMLRAIAKREGLGDLLAEGVAVAAGRLGPRATGLAVHVKGLEVPMHEPRLKHGLGLGYAVSPTGADHCHNLHDTLYEKPGRMLENLRPLGIYGPVARTDLGPAKLRLFHAVSRLRHLVNCLGVCYFVPWSPQELVGLTAAVTGWNTSLYELMQAVDRVITLARCFNVREGFTRDDDRLPGRLHEAFSSGPLQGQGLDEEGFRRLLQMYYELMGWDAGGRPTPGRLASLGLEEFA
ncbi:MAG: aldehyde ferredoxin oxidoreductase family protein [bacterium]|nr:aldehyde ferredoxin oxidoreductase family protein [bacterium]